jgi:hypothetical protein
VSRETVKSKQPEDVPFDVPIFHTPNACCGAATAYLLRQIAYRAGAYAPGIQEDLFYELNTSHEGGSIEKVQRWFNGRVTALHELGYRLQCRRVASPTAAILDWVKQGKGHRAAMLPTSFRKLHPEPDAAGAEIEADSVAHAIGLAVDRLSAKASVDLVMIDPWPGVQGGAEDRSAVPIPALEQAHRDRGNQSLVYFWAGWS